MKISHLYDEIYIHLQKELPRECCGIIAKKNEEIKYFPCNNLAKSNQDFILDPEDLVIIEDSDYEPIVIVHSHPYTNILPSETDRVSIEQTQLTWLIMDGQKNVGIYNPTGYIPPLEGRVFHYGVIDCYTLIKDYYKLTFNIEISDFERYTENWWNDYGTNFEEYYTKEGFIPFDISSIKEHDLLVMCIGSPHPNHYGIYLGNSTMLHHAAGRLSCKEKVTKYYNSIRYVLRRKELV